MLTSCIVFVVLEEKSEAAGNEIFVDDDPYMFRDGSAEHPYKTIQQAIDAASDGDTIYVFGGDYNETLRISKRLTLVGSIEEGVSFINYGADHKYTIEITADYVNLSGFDIFDDENHVISDIQGALIHITSSHVIIHKNNITNCQNGWGIYLDSTNGHLIKNNTINNVITGVYSYFSNTNDFVDNTISNCSSSSVRIRSSHHNTFYNNILDNNIYGIYALACEKITINNNTIEGNSLRGVGLYGGIGNNTIKYNTITNNANDGIYLNSPEGEVMGNSFDGNLVGIRLEASGYTITDNYVSNSASTGINIMPSSSQNIIYLNSFYGNDVNALDQGSTTWYNESLRSGNTWDDYNEVDSDEDGIGDEIYQNSGVYDIYPLGVFLSPPNKPTTPSPEDGADNVGLKITLSVEVTDPDGDLMDVYFYRFSNDTMSYSLIDTNYNVFSGGSASCSFNLPFDTNFMWFTVVKDSKLENSSDIWYFTTRNRPMTNEPPVADAGGPYSAKTNQSITFDASESYDPDGSIEFYRWNFGDGTSEILSVSPIHIYYSAGTYDVILTVIDENGTSDMEIVKVTITSLEPGTTKPVANLGESYSGRVGDAISFSSSGSTDSDGTIVTYSWDFGDGQTSNEQNPSHTYTTAGKYTVNLTVTDNDGLSDSDSVEILVSSKKTEGTPGFELIISIFSILVIYILLVRKKKFL